MNLKNNQSIWNLAGNVAYAASHWIVAVAISRSLGAEDLGTYSLALSVVTPIFLFFSLQLRSRYVAENNQNNLLSTQSFFFNRVTLSFLALICSLLLGINFFDENQYLVLLFIALYKMFEINSDFIFAVFHRKNDLLTVGRIQIIKSILIIMSVVGIAFLKGELFYIASAVCLVYMIIHIFYEYKILNKIEVNPKIFFNNFTNQISSQSKIIKESLPLGTAALLISFNINIPKYYLDMFNTSENLGIFSAAFHFYLIGNLIINSFAQTAMVKLSKSFTEDISSFKFETFKLLGFSIGLGLLGCLIAIFLGEELLALIYGQDFSKGKNAFFILMISTPFAFIGSAASFVVLGTQVFKIQILCALCMAVVSLFGGYFFIKEWGLVGASYTILASVFVQALFNSTIVFYRAFKKN